MVVMMTSFLEGHVILPNSWRTSAIKDNPLAIALFSFIYKIPQKQLPRSK
jgi:hypothetical protein